MRSTNLSTLLTALLAAVMLPANSCIGAEPTSLATGNLPILNSPSLLKGRVTTGPSPFLEGKVESMPAGTLVNVQMSCHLNSQVSHKGDEILGRIAADTTNGQRVLLPSGWFIHGLVTDVEGRHRLGRAGYVEVEFDKIISPQGDYELPFKTKFSTRDNRLTAVSKIVAIDTGYVSYGALGGAICAVQFGGIGTAIATYGLSVAGGAAIGGTLGLIGGLKRKGDIASIFPGDVITMDVAEPISLPVFDPKMLSLAHPAVGNSSSIKVNIDKVKFSKDPLGDRKTRVLTLDLTIDNRSSRELSFDQLVVMSDHSLNPYPPYLARSNFVTLKEKISPKSRKSGQLAFSVDSPKYKYFLVLFDRARNAELSRLPIN
jgi:hypothetical protein